MQFETKVLYNLLRLNYEENRSLKVEKWQVEDLRLLDIDDIMNRLKELDVHIDKEKFIAYSENFDTPEEFSSFLLSDIHDEKLQDEIFLLIFELWRRWLFQKQSITIFCDELDHRIFLYESHDLSNDELIQDILANLQDILEDNVDDGMDAAEVFLSIARFCAHDLESFLFDYISDQIEINNTAYAQELLDGFYPYMMDIKWFDFLKAKIVACSNIFSANEIIKTLIKELSCDMNIMLAMEVLEFLVENGDPTYFVKLVKFVFPYIKKEEDFQILAKIVADYYRRLDKEELEKEVLSILKLRLENKQKEILEETDVGFQNFQKIFTGEKSK